MKKFSLFMLMAVGLLISGNLRADNVCKIVGGNEYATLQEAFNAAESGQTIQMIANVNIEDNKEFYAKVGKDKNCILDLNGCKISKISTSVANIAVIQIDKQGTLTIKDEKGGGEIYFKGANNGFGAAENTILNNGTLTIDGGTFVNASNWSASYVIDHNSANTCVINGGTFSCKTDDGKYENPAIRIYDQQNFGHATVSLTVNGGTIEGQRVFYLQKANNSKIELVVNNGIFTAYGTSTYPTVNPANCRFIDSQYSDNNTTLSGVTISVGKENEATQPDITGFMYLAGGGSDNPYNDYETKGLELLNIYGGNFKTANPIKVPQSDDAKVFACAKKNNRWNVSGGQFVFSEESTPLEVIAGVQLGLSDEKGAYAIDFSGFKKFYGMAEVKNWTDMGYVLEPTDQFKGENWYVVKKVVSGSAAYDNFKTMIDNSAAGVKETVQGTVRNVNVIPVHGADHPITEKTTWPTTDAGSQVVLQGSAEVTIPANTTVEAYSVTVPTGSTLNVENNATLIVGAGGVTTATGEETISINIGSNEGSGAIKISPDAPADKAQPRVRIKLTTIAHIDQETNSWHWQYFARPTGVDPESFKVVSGTEHGATQHYLKGYRGETNDYVDIILTDEGGLSQLKNYEGYAICNNSTNGGVVYQFEGKLNGNQNAKINFKNKGFSLMGNSYLAPVSMEGLFKGIIEGATVPSETPITTAPAISKAPTEEGGNAVEWTIWVYNCADKRFVQTTSLQAKAKKTQLQPMQGFFMRLREGTSLTAAIDYVGAVWNNNAQAGPILAPAHNDNGMGTASIVVSANGCADQIDLFEDAEFDNSFNNGADASKLMNLQGMFNLYAQTEAGTLSCVATDNMEGTILTFQANNASEYELSFNGVANMNYSLIDLFNGEVVEMADGNVYKFFATPNSTEARFQIVEGYKAPTAMEKVNNVKAVKGIFSMTGAYMGEVKDFNALPAGVYVVNGQQIVK